jgi:hypothetical protein
MSEDSLINDEQDTNKNIQQSSARTTTTNNSRVPRQLKSTINGK